MTRILICGINGFLGSAMGRYAYGLKARPSVHGLARQATNHGDATVWNGNLNHRKSVETILRKVQPDIIFQFAGGRLNNDQKTFEANFTTTKTLLETVHALKNI